MALPTCFKPKKKYSLHRFGKDFDGGYLVGKDTILNSDTLISFGINDDWSFEKDFKKVNLDSKVICYDDKPILKYLCKAPRLIGTNTKLSGPPPPSSTYQIKISKNVCGIIF